MAYVNEVYANRIADPKKLSTSNQEISHHTEGFFVCSPLDVVTYKSELQVIHIPTPLLQLLSMIQFCYARK